MTPPPMDGPRPDSVTVPPKLFSAAAVKDSEEGLFVFVRDGHIEVATASDVLHLGRGEAGFAGRDGEARRPLVIPKFIEFDRMPLPTVRGPAIASLLQETASRQNNQCR